jgi:pyridoxine kinase
VDIINTVEFSNHAGYRHHGGNRVDAQTLTSIISALDHNGLLNPSRLLTGYIPSKEALTIIATLVQRLRDRFPHLVYLLDPVMGDDGKLYVAADVLPIYRDNLLPLATIITPNWFEVELLTGLKLSSASSLREAIRQLHRRGVAHIVISSLPVSQTLAGTLPSYLQARTEPNDLYTGDSLLCVCSSSARVPSRKEPEITEAVYAASVPRIKGYFSGVGDLFSALVVAHYEEGCHEQAGSALSYATSCALSATHSILVATRKASIAAGVEAEDGTDDEKDARDPMRRIRRMRARELRIVAEQERIRNGGAAWKLSRWTDFWECEAKL